MPESRHIMVRLDRATHARLCEVRTSLLDAHYQCKIGLEMDSRDRVSLDQVINILVDLRNEHAARRKKSAKRRRQRGRADQATAGVPQLGNQGHDDTRLSNHVEVA